MVGLQWRQKPAAAAPPLAWPVVRLRRDEPRPPPGGRHLPGCPALQCPAHPARPALAGSRSLPAHRPAPPRPTVRWERVHHFHPVARSVATQTDPSPGQADLEVAATLLQAVPAPGQMREGITSTVSEMTSPTMLMEPLLETDSESESGSEEEDEGRTNIYEEVLGTGQVGDVFTGKRTTPNWSAGREQPGVEGGQHGRLLHLPHLLVGRAPHPPAGEQAAGPLLATPAAGAAPAGGGEGGPDEAAALSRRPLPARSAPEDGHGTAT